MKQIINSDAEAEFLEAIEYLTLESGEETAIRYANEIEAQLKQIMADSERFALAGYKDYRKSGPTRVFKYNVYYAIEPNGAIYVVAFAHYAREPRYWHSRDRERA